jgi:fructokinase
VRVLIVGDLAVVLTSAVPRLPEPGENFLLPSPGVYASGVAANLAGNLRRLGFEIDVIGGVGRDALADYILGDLKSAGIGVTGVSRNADPTSIFVILVDDEGERTMIGFRGASERFPLDRTVLEERVPDWIHISGYTLLDREMAARCEGLVLEAEARGIPCSVDLEGIAHSGLRTSLDRITAFCNLTEYRRYFDRDVVRPMPRSAPLVVKGGEEGCFLIESGTVVSCGAFPASVVDSTGAGDAFNAGFIAARLRGENARIACAWGNAAARLKVERPGPRAELSVESIEDLVSARGTGD